MKPIIHIPNPVLTSPAKPVTFFDKRLTSLIADMTDALIKTKNPKGVGLAATQIGEPYRVFVTRPTSKDPIRAFINPAIIASSLDTKDLDEIEGKLEGCLSIPGIWGKVKRSIHVTLSYINEKGITHEETFRDFQATIIQHETDHINGILFTHRVVEQKGKVYQAAHDKEGKEVLEEIRL